ncbi:MAG: DUF2723 domain-containing protein [Methylotenera sp.]|nr:DUF2723 domain-containing protein [Oligoflexia bacterium]
MARTISTHVDSHNITMITGWLFACLPFGELAFKLNLVSSFYAALAVTFFYFTLLEQFDRKALAWAGSILLMISHALWWHATILESYATNAFFTSMGLLFMVRLEKYGKEQDLYWLCGISGFAIFNHVSMGFLCIAALFAAIVRMVQVAHRAGAIFIRCAGSALLGLSPWLALFIRDWINFNSLSFAINHAFFGPFKGMMLAGTFDANFTDFLLIYLTNFPNLLLICIPFGFYFIFKAWGRKSASLLAILTQLSLVSVFAFTYQTWNKFSFGQPALVIFCFIGCFSLNEIFNQIESRKSKRLEAAVALALMASIFFPIYLYGKLSTWGMDRSSIWSRKYSDGHAPNAFRVNEYIGNPLKTHFTDYDTFCRLTLAQLPSGAILFDDDGRSFYQFTDYFQKQLGLRPDLNIQVMNSFAYDNIGWGQNPQSAGAILRNAYFEDRLLYTTSLSFPFSRALESMPANERFHFVKVPLDEAHWIYQLVTQKDEAQAFLTLQSDYARDYRSLKVFSEERPSPGLKRKNSKFTEKRDVAQKDWVHDFMPGNILFSGRASITTQNMHEYGSFWKNQDQLFVRGEAPGAWVESILESPATRKVSMEINFTTSYDYGRVDLYLNEQPLLRDVDLYSRDVFHKVVQVPPFEIPAGKNRLIFKINGKNQQSTGLVMGLDFIKVRAL